MSFFSKFWENLKDWKQFSKYLMVGIVVFIIGLIWHFPLERFGSIITSTVQKQTGYIVQMQSLSLTFPIGVTGEKLTIQSPPNVVPPIMLQLDKLTLRPSLLELIAYPFRRAVGFSYRAVRGKEIWSGSASFGKENTSFNVKAKNFEWSGTFPLDPNSPFAGKTVSIHTIVDVQLSIEGKTVALQQGNLSEAQGSLSVNSKKTDIDAPMVNQLGLTDATIEADLQKGKLNIKNVNLIAPNLSAKATGEMKIEPFFPNSHVKMDAQLKGDPKDATITSLLSLVGSLYGIQPGAEGTLDLKINATLNSPERMSIRGQ